jgi:hypothetical protein
MILIQRYYCWVSGLVSIILAFWKEDSFSETGSISILKKGICTQFLVIQKVGVPEKQDSNNKSEVYATWGGGNCDMARTSDSKHNTWKLY